MRESINLKAILLAKLDESDLDNLANFTCVLKQDGETQREFSESMNVFLVSEAYDQQQLGLNTTILLYYKGDLAGFVSLCADAIRLEENEMSSDLCAYPIAPAIKIARLAVDARFQGIGFGTFLIDYVRDTCFYLAENIGVRFITLDAVSHRISYYLKLGFRENQVYSRDKRRQLVSMRTDVFDVEN